jgi:hypothetical protein
MPPPSQFLLIDTQPNSKGEYVIFDIRFPESIETSHGANWREQDTVGGVQPLFYVNSAPGELSIGGLLLDGTSIGASVAPDIERLTEMLRPKEGGGTPPVLIASWGDEKFYGVLVSLNIKRLLCDDEGNPLRALADLRLRELQGAARPRRATDNGQQTRPRRVAG